MKSKRFATALLLLTCVNCAAFGQSRFSAPESYETGHVFSTLPTNQPKSLWGFHTLSAENRDRCRGRLCKLPGILANRSARESVPESTPPPPPIPNGPLSPAELAAAKIKADESTAQNRLASVRFLGTVDCHYYPEAEAGILAALRCDRNEAVRFEAAMAILQGCCCSRRTVEALNHVISGSDKDGNPVENSDRVKQVASRALQRCLSLPMNVPATLPEPPTAPPQVSGLSQASYRGPSSSASDALLQARREYAERVGTTPPPAAPRSRSLFENLLPGRAARQEAPPEPSTPPAPLPPLAPIGVIPTSP